ncbi:MAG: hypothetical protein IJF49_06755 [Clostridia bacterium]|nr:hypothetical protein [Clostridia bacterium]
MDNKRNSTRKITNKVNKKSWLDSYTKLIVLVILINAIAWVWCSYGLAYLGRYEIAESLSQTAITTILGTVIAYCTKSTVENVNRHGVNLLPTNGTAANSKMKRDY